MNMATPSHETSETERVLRVYDALNTPEFDEWTRVDAAWTPKQPAGVRPENENDG
jgi:pyocin large subunit-like protein